MRRIHFEYTPITLAAAKVGTSVRYHPIIGRQADDGQTYTISCVGTLEHARRFGSEVVWLHGKSGCVAIAALSPAPTEG